MGPLKIVEVSVEVKVLKGVIDSDNVQALRGTEMIKVEMYPL